jgi:hypothetical protein
MKKIIMLSLLLSGCATAGKVRTEIANDLSKIVENSDCQANCEMIKLYIKTKLQ